jgi:hypothetical protein
MEIPDPAFIRDTLSALNRQASRPPYYWPHSGQFVERWEWLASTDSTERKREFYRKYRGRTNSIWKSEYAELNPENWTEPLFSLNVNTQQPSPFRNAIHMRNSKDGTTVDELYIAPKIYLRPPCVLDLDAYIPALNTTNYPNGAYLGFGFEVNSGMYISGGFILEIYSNGTTVTCQLRYIGLRDGSTVSITTSVTGLNTGRYCDYKLILYPYRLELWQGTTAGQGYPMSKVAELTVNIDYNVIVIPAFFNEGSVIVSGVYLGQFMAYEITGRRVVRKVVDVSSIAAGGYTDSGVLTLPKESVVSAVATYGSTATAGVRVYILAANDSGGTIIDTENTTDAFTYFEPTFAAGATRQRTVNLDNLPKYCKILVRNLDGSVATGAVKVYVHEVF